MLTTRGPLARFPGLNVRPESGAIEALASVEEEHIDALAGQIPRRHAA
jgi:hypothetical protein